MDRYTATMNAFLAGVGSAFALFPNGQLDTFLKRDSVENRVAANFRRVGERLDSTMTRVRDEQKDRTQSTR